MDNDKVFDLQLVYPGKNTALHVRCARMAQPPCREELLGAFLILFRNLYLRVSGISVQEFRILIRLFPQTVLALRAHDCLAELQVLQGFLHQESGPKVRSGMTCKKLLLKSIRSNELSLPRIGIHLDGRLSRAIVEMLQTRKPLSPEGSMMGLSEQQQTGVEHGD